MKKQNGRLQRDFETYCCSGADNMFAKASNSTEKSNKVKSKKK